MIWHPLTWAFWAAAVTGGLIYAMAAVRAMDVVLNWAPESADIRQLQRERHAETASLLGRWSLACLAAAAILLLTGIAVIWTAVVPGAMCGTGVLQAMGTAGSRAMLFWSATLITLYGWRVLDGLDHHMPNGGLTQSGARVLITASPFLVLALFYSWQALMRVENDPTVSCCAAVYDQVLNDPVESGSLAWIKIVSLWGSQAGSIIMLAIALISIRLPHRVPGVLLAAISIPWGIGSTIAVKHVWAAYYYQVLSHPCPWCLFLPDYRGAGFFIFGSMAVVIMESVALWLAIRTRCRYPILAEPVIHRIRQSAWRIGLAVVTFTILTAGPAIAWRLRTGVWLTGYL